MARNFHLNRIKLGMGAAAFALAVSCPGRQIPRPALAARLAEGPEIIGIVHWGLNTYTDKEWGFGDEDPAMLNPVKFDSVLEASVTVEFGR